MTACRACLMGPARQAHSIPALQPPPARPAAWWQSSSLSRATGICLAGLVVTAQLPPPAVASVLHASEVLQQRAQALEELAARYQARSAAPQLRYQEESVPQRLARLQQLTAEGSAAAAAGNYAAALAAYDSVVKQFPDFATTEYARLSRALLLYQLGRTSDAILQLEDLEVALRGYSEVHAALAAVLYTERPALLDQAETQWEIAMEFNPKFSDPSWVAANKHWPPRLMTALDRFLNLK
ncbi:hypothetical protein D9Q98_001182 [Chlorella vulgaris]|uniref:Uncharacterized protein n=1 Tax=Chlorella vulgaris TaxID=3077 RepID=A0A9D4U0L9_CHLVU|nr:hypothetical protein D9Q98_001182 [Chlorella vulgaris]